MPTINNEQEYISGFPKQKIYDYWFLSKTHNKILKDCANFLLSLIFLILALRHKTL